MGGREEPDRPCGEWHHWPGSGEEGEQFGFSTLVFVVVACVCVCTRGMCVRVVLGTSLSLVRRSGHLT